MFNKRVKNLQPYTVSERDKFIHDKEWLLLDWNESTLSTPIHVQNVLIEVIQNGFLNYYPDTHSKEALTILSNYLKIEASKLSIFNGSDSALNISFECLLNENDIVSVYGPEYSQIFTFIEMKGAKINLIKCANIFEFDVDFINSSIKNSKVFYISNPNNPTGRFIKTSILNQLISNNPNTFFFIDEAYIDFASENSIKLIEKYDNVIIFRTFSKAFGLASLRIGYVISSDKNIMYLNKVRNGKEVNLLAQKAISEILKNDSEIKSHIESIKNIRNWFFLEINKLNGFLAYESHSNFVLIKHSKHLEIISYLFDNKILVRDRSSLNGLENCFRITIGNEFEMKKVLDVIKKWNETNYTRS